MKTISNCCDSAWTRIVVLLPVNTQAERNACASCRATLFAHYCDELTFNRHPNTFVRYYPNTNPAIPLAWIFDDVCMVTGDINLAIIDPKLQAIMLLFQVDALNHYEREGVPQSEI